MEYIDDYNVVVAVKAQAAKVNVSTESSPSLNTANVTVFGFVRSPNTMDQVMQFVEPSRQFVKDSIRLVKRCTKPDRKGRFTLFFIWPRLSPFSIHLPTGAWTARITPKIMIVVFFHKII